MKVLIKVGIALTVALLIWGYWPGSESAAVELAHNVLKQPQQQNSADLSGQPVPTSHNNKSSYTSTTTDTAKVCLSAAELGTALQQLQQQRVRLTNQLIDIHIKLGVKKPVTLQRLQAVGGDLEVFQFRQSAHKNNFARFQKQIEPVVIDIKAIISFQAAIAKQDYEQLLQLIQQHPEVNRHRLYIEMDLSLLGSIIIANPEISFSIIQQFINVGIEPFFGDLAAFTALDLPLPLIDMVQQHFKGDLQQEWQDNFREYNLTLLAAENARAELFDYWRTLGIPASLQHQAPNAFDLIPLPNSELQLQHQLSKVRSLLTAGILPRAADVRSQWLLVLPEQEAQQLSELLRQQPETLFDQDGPDATQLYTLQQLQTEFNQLIRQAKACPNMQLWPAGHAGSREIPERQYLTKLKLKQHFATSMKDIPAQDIKNSKLIAELLEKNDWRGIKDFMQVQQNMSAEDADVNLLMLMTVVNAKPEDLQLHLNTIIQLNNQQLNGLAQLASPAQRELFKAAGFELPIYAETEKSHNRLHEIEHRKKELRYSEDH